MGVTRGNLFGVVFIAVALTAVVLHRQVVPHLDAVGTSFPGYWVVAREIRAGTPAVKLYDDAWLAERMAAEGFPSDRMLGPPTLSLTALPVSGWEYPLARKIWLLGVLTPALLGSVAWLAAPLGLRAGAVFAAAVALSQPVAAGMAVGQVYPLMLALHCVGLWGWRRDRPLIGGLGLAPMVLARGWYGLPQTAGWLVAGRLRGALATPLWATAGGLITLPLVGAAAWRFFLLEQVPQSTNADTTMALAYQTWRSLALHLTTFHPALGPDPPLPGLGSGPYLIGAGVIAAATLLAGRHLRPGASGVGFALWTCAALLGAPFAEDHHMLLAALPAAVLWAEAPKQRGWVLAAAVLLVPDWGFDRPELLGGWRSLAGYPRVFGVGMLWMGCLGAARADMIQRRKEAP